MNSVAISKKRMREEAKKIKKTKLGLRRLNLSFFSKKAFEWVFAIFRTLLIIGLAYVILYPVFNMLSRSFNVDYVGSATSIWIPRKVGMDNVGFAMKYLNYWPSFWTSIQVAFGSALLQVVSSALAGYGFARFKFKGRSILFVVVILTMVVPAQTYLIPMYVQYRNFDFFGIMKLVGLFAPGVKGPNFLGTAYTMWIPALLGVGLRGGLFIYIFRQFFRGMSKELEDAAYIDGCGPYLTFLRIMAPNAGASALVVFLFSLVWHWNDYFVSGMMFMSSRGTKPLTVMLIAGRAKFYSNFTDVRTQFNQGYIMNASALLVIIPLIVVFAFAQRYFIESMDKVGIKG